MSIRADRIPELNNGNVSAGRMIFCALTLVAGITFSAPVNSWARALHGLLYLIAVGVICQTIAHALWLRHEIAGRYYHGVFDFLAGSAGVGLLLWSAFPNVIGTLIVPAVAAVVISDAWLRSAAERRMESSNRVCGRPTVAATWRAAYQGDLDAVRELERLYFDSDLPEHRMLSVLRIHLERRGEDE